MVFGHRRVLDTLWIVLVGQKGIRSLPAADLIDLLAADPAGPNPDQNLSHTQRRNLDLRHFKRRTLPYEDCRPHEARAFLPDLNLLRLSLHVYSNTM
jgi:hypothetical protein